MEERISYRQERAFGETFNIAVKFIRQNFKVLFQSLLFIAGPFILFSAIAAVYYQNSLASNVSRIFRYGSFHPLTLLNYQYFISSAVSALANLVIAGVVFEYMKLYRDIPREEITVSRVGKELRKDFLKLLGTLAVIYLCIFGFIIVAGGISIGLSTVHWSLAVLLVIAVVIAGLLLVPNILYLISTIYLVRATSNSSIGVSFSEARYGMKDNYWWTWLLMLCLFLILLAISVAVAMPQAVLTQVFFAIGKSLEEVRIYQAIVKVVTSTLYILLSSFTLVIMAFHHFSLIESKNGVGLMERINEIGSKPKNNVEQLY